MYRHFVCRRVVFCCERIKIRSEDSGAFLFSLVFFLDERWQSMSESVEELKMQIGKYLCI